MVFLWLNLIAFPRTEMKTNDQKKSNTGCNESPLDLSLVENYIRIFEIQILSSTYYPAYHYTNELHETNRFSQIPISIF